MSAYINVPVDSIKLYAWEFAFIRKILFVRNEEELKMLKKIGLVTVRTFHEASDFQILSIARTVHKLYNVEWHSMSVKYTQFAPFLTHVGIIW